MERNILKQLPGALLPWYRVNKRDLPWRQDQNPYHIWLSEIMLQQTRVEAVKGYYARFLQALPTISQLAACDDDRLHKLWEGLGYYSRVRNLKKAAQVIVSEYSGQFPDRGFILHGGWDEKQNKWRKIKAAILLPGENWGNDPSCEKGGPDS